jgi:hypothetical protein
MPTFIRTVRPLTWAMVSAALQGHLIDHLAVTLEDYLDARDALHDCLENGYPTAKGGGALVLLNEAIAKSVYTTRLAFTAMGVPSVPLVPRRRDPETIFRG